MTDFTEEISYSIGELSKLVSTSPRTIRYYEEIGILDPPKKKSNKRIYNNKDLRRLKFIKRLKLLGLSLAEMAGLKKIYRIQQSNNAVLLKLLDLLDHHEERLDQNIRDLKKLKTEITSYKTRINTKLNRNNNVKSARR